jgi:hypothetical protein
VGEETQLPRFNLHLRPEFEAISHANFASVGFRKWGLLRQQKGGLPQRDGHF